MKPVFALGLAALPVAFASVLLWADRAPEPRSGRQADGAPSHRLSPERGNHSDASLLTAAVMEPRPADADLLPAVEAESDPDRRDELLKRSVESVAPAHLPALLGSLVRLSSPGAAELRQLLVQRWTENDAPAAAAWAAGLTEGSGRRSALEHVAITWANRDLPAAVAWLQTLPEDESRLPAAVGLAYEAARTDPVTALQVASALPSSPERDELLVHALSQWAAAEATQARAWAGQVADLALRQRLVAAVAVAVAEQDGQAAATLAATALGAGAEQDHAAVSILQRWAQQSPMAAAAWLVQFPDLPVREAAVHNLVALWAGQNLEAVGDWLYDLPTGSLRDTGLDAYAQALEERNRALTTTPPE
jgi:hypothetical protein